MTLRVVLDLHGTRAQEGVEIDALESFLGHFRGALREFDRSRRGTLPRRGGRPNARDAASNSFRLVEFRKGSGIAMLESVRPRATGPEDDLALDDRDNLSMATLRGLLDAVNIGERLAEPVVEALGNARRAIGDDGSFGVEFAGDGQVPRVVFDEPSIRRLQRPAGEEEERAVKITGRLHMIEVDQPGRRIGIRAQDGAEWTCSYPDDLHRQVTTFLERLVRVEGVGRKLTATTGRLRIERLESLPEHAQSPLFEIEPVPLAQLRSAQSVERPQGLDALIDDEWEDDEESRLFLEATLGSTRQG